MQKTFCSLFLASLVVFFVLPIHAQNEVDYLGLAQILVKDGRYQRAERTLKKITEPEEDQRALLASLWGLVHLQKKNYAKALVQFDESLALGIESKEVYLYRAEALLQLGNYGDASQSLEKVGAEERQKITFYLLKAEILWRQGERHQAWAVLDEAKAQGLSKNIVAKKKFYYLLEQGLYQAAVDMAFKSLQDPNTFNDVVAMASQLRLKKQYDLSLQLLQALTIIRPEKEMVALEMAQNYLALDQKFSAALIMEQAAKHNTSLSYEASELLRQVGKSYRARFLNLSNTDPQLQLKQKLALHLEDDDYLSLKFMIPQLRRNQLLEDQEIRYAVAYSLFRTGDFSKSEFLLNKIDKDGLFEKSLELKREILDCQQQKWACHETI